MLDAMMLLQTFRGQLEQIKVQGKVSDDSLVLVLTDNIRKKQFTVVRTLPFSTDVYTLLTEFSKQEAADVGTDNSSHSDNPKLAACR